MGQRTSAEVLDSAPRLADPPSREIHTLAAHEISHVDIVIATGTLPGQDRMIWQAIGLD